LMKLPIVSFRVPKAVTQYSGTPARVKGFARDGRVHARRPRTPIDRPRAPLAHHSIFLDPSVRPKYSCRRLRGKASQIPQNANNVFLLTFHSNF
jgi:hypothetical protein